MLVSSIFFLFRPCFFSLKDKFYSPFRKRTVDLFLGKIPLFHWVLIGRCLTLDSINTQQTAFKNIVEKEEIAHNEKFLLFPQCFLLDQIILPHSSIFLTSYFYLLLNWNFKCPKLPLSTFSVTSQWQFTYSCISWFLPVLGWSSGLFLWKPVTESDSLWNLDPDFS